jgi:RNA polymerase sigma factor (sigma-70 family)
MATTTLTAHEAATLQRLFDSEFSPLLDRVYRFAFYLTGDATLAEDLTQETFLKAWRFIGRYTPNTNARAWLCRICRNAYINHLRSKKNLPIADEFENILIAHRQEDDQLVPDRLNFHEEMEGYIMDEEVANAINALPKNYRTIVLLELEEYSYEEMAVMLNIPIGTVRSRLHRGRKTLATSLENYAKSRGYETESEDQLLDVVAEAGEINVDPGEPA